MTIYQITNSLYPVKQISSGLTRCLNYLSALTGILLMGGCNLDTRMSTFVTKGPVAETQYDLFMLTVWVTLGIFIAVGGAFAFAIIKFRERPNDDRPMPSQRKDVTTP